MAETQILSSMALRLRSACDSCRQSKVKCTGGSTCSRCMKQDVTCRYSPASRAGKPKGSKNKATLKKLEHHQERNQHTMHLSKNAIGPSTWEAFRSSTPVSHCPTTAADNYHQMSYERSVSTAQVGWSPQSLADGQGQAMIQSPSVSSNTSTNYSPLLTGTDDYFLSGTSMTDSDPYVGLNDLPQVSPTQSYFPHSPTQDIGSSFQSPIEPSTPEEACTCFESQATSLIQLYSLDREMAVWHFDAAIQAVNSSLTACQKLLHCQACRNDCCNLLVSISTLDLLFRVFGQLLSHDISQDGHPADESCNSCCGQYNVSHQDRPSMRDLVIHGMLYRSRETLTAMKEAVNTCGNSNLEGYDWGENVGIENYDLVTKEKEGNLMAALFQMQYDHRQPDDHTTASPPVNRLTPSDIEFTHQVIARCESILDTLGSFTSHYRYTNPGMGTGTGGTRTVSMLSWI